VISDLVFHYYSIGGNTAMSGGIVMEENPGGSVLLIAYSVLIARCNNVSVRLSVRLSVTEVHWRIIAN